VVRLDASASTDSDTDTLGYAWSQVSGPTIVLATSTGANTSFTAPALDGEVILQLEVSDGANTGRDTVTIQVVNHQPQANTGDDISTPPGGRVALNGSASSDPDADNLTYLWTQASGFEVQLSSNNSPTPYFDAPETGGNLVFQLVVHDGTTSSLPAESVVSVLAYNGATVTIEEHPFRSTATTVGDATDVVTANGYAYVASGAQGLVVIDIEGEGTPMVIGSASTTGDAVAITVTGSLAFVAASTAGLRIFDISNPQAPALIGNASTSAAVTAVAAVSSRAYAADLDGNLTIFDVQIPSEPTPVGSLRAVAGEATALHVQGTTAFVGGSAQLSIIDVQQGGAPQRLADIATDGPVRGITVIGELVFYSDDAGVTLLNATDRESPEIVGRQTFRGVPHGLFATTERIYVTIPELSAVEVIDITDPAEPIHLGNYTTPGPARAVYVAGSLAAVADGNVQIIGVTNPRNPTLLSQLPLPGRANGVEVLSGVAYVAGPDLHIVTAPRPVSPQLVSTVSTDAEAMSVAVEGNYAYVASGADGLLMVDVTDVAAPRIVGRYNTAEPAVAVAVGPGVAYVAAGARGIEIIDTTSPPNFTLHNSYDTAGQATALVVDGDHLFIADGPGGLVILDVSNPRNPQLVADDPTPTAATNLDKQNEILLVASAEEGVFVYDVADPTRPELLAIIATPAPAIDVTADQEFAYVTAGIDGVLQYDLSDPKAPLFVGAYNAGQSAHSIDISQGVAWVVDTSASSGQSSLHALNVATAMVGQLDDSYDVASPGVVLRYRVSNLDPALNLRCLVTGGTCTIVSVDREQNTASLEWELPQDAGDYELAIAVGEHRVFRLAGRDRVFVR
jgi:hypothetical protein